MFWIILGVVLIALAFWLGHKYDEVFGIIPGAFGVFTLLLSLVFGIAAQVGGPSEVIKYNQTKEYVQSLYGKDITPQERTFVIEKIMAINQNIDATNQFKKDFFAGWPFQYEPYGELEKLDISQLNVPLTRVEMIK